MSNEPECPQKSPVVSNMEPGEYWWCSCGRSKGQPFCDGSHAGTDFVPKRVVVEEAKTIAWCACKRSENGEFCDGAHSRID
ncbi:MAG: CDGSH iron-sulfur domain-containing protein [Planctomycetota bacterium]